MLNGYDVRRIKKLEDILVEIIQKKNYLLRCIIGFTYQTKLLSNLYGFCNMQT